VIFKPFLVAEMSGAMGGLVASHNSGGQYLRSRVVPTDPQTANQVLVRNTVGTLANRWASTLTEVQRGKWLSYANAVLLPNRLGDSRRVSPLAHFIRSNTPRVQSGAPIVDDGPGLLNLGDFDATAAGISADGTTGDVDLFFSNTDSWATTTGGFLLLYLSRPKSPTVNFFKGPYNYVNRVTGNTTTPPTSPSSGIAVPWPISTGQKLFYQLRATASDGRLSFVSRGSTLVT
jgi:hypothetical protein